MTHLKSDIVSGSASVSRGEGTKIKGSGERGGVVETKGPSSHDSPAREGGSDQFSPNCSTGGDKACLPFIRVLRVTPLTRNFPLNSHNRRLCNLRQMTESHLKRKQIHLTLMNNQTSTHEMRQNSISGLFMTALISHLQVRSVFLFFQCWLYLYTVFIPLWLFRIPLSWLICLSSERKVVPACARKSLNSPLPCKNTSLWCRWDNSIKVWVKFSNLFINLLGWHSCGSRRAASTSPNLQLSARSGQRWRAFGRTVQQHPIFCFFSPASAGKSQSDSDFSGSWTKRHAAGAEEEREGEEGVWKSLAKQQGGLEDRGGETDAQPAEERQAHPGRLKELTPL